MSRGVKDLRELICVSRLTVRDSDEEYPLSDEDGRFSQLSLSGSDSRQSSAHSGRTVGDPTSPDSGVGTNGKAASPENGLQHDHLSPTEPKILPHEVVRPKSSQRKKKKKKKKKSKDLCTLPTMHEFPKSAALPPVGADADCTSRPSSSSSNNSAPDMSSVPLGATKQAPAAADQNRVNYDEMLTYFDATVASDWLESTNKNLNDLSIWCHTGENFVNFAQFWLTDFLETQRNDIFKLEYSILVDNLQFAFTSGRSSGKVKFKHLSQFLGAVFREYPNKLMSAEGSYMFLDYLEVMSSERQSAYKKLLTDVKCSTRIKQHAQWMLAARAFALVSVWSAVLAFYQRLTTDASPFVPVPTPTSATAQSGSHLLHIYQAIRLGYVDVLQYLLKTGKVRSVARDEHGRTLVFTAVMHNQAKVLQYLTTQVKPRPDVNMAADTGNTPLHAAANNGSRHLVDILLNTPSLDVNAKNVQCEGATALHLAVMHGHKEVVARLLQAKVDVSAKMGDLSAVDIARDFGHDEVLECLQKKALLR